MDTNDLSIMAYEVFNMADDIERFLTIELACMSAEYKAEDDYLVWMVDYLREVYEEAEEYIEECGREDEISVDQFRKMVKGVEAHINKTLATPVNERGVTVEHLNWGNRIYMTNLSHMLDDEGNLVKDAPVEARELASFMSLVVDTATASPSFGVSGSPTNIRCFKEGCGGLIYAGSTLESDVEWCCQKCYESSGIITGWQGTKWDNSNSKSL